jgi:hypothetical protein
MLMIDIWLDVDDEDTQQAAKRKDDKALAWAIEWGLMHCTHLLALISPRTKGSWWVPFEIGACRGRNKDLTFFVHKDVEDSPSYLIFGRTIIDQLDFYRWAERISAYPETTKAYVRVQEARRPSTLNSVLPYVRSR